MSVKPVASAAPFQKITYAQYDCLKSISFVGWLIRVLSVFSKVAYLLWDVGDIQAFLQDVEAGEEEEDKAFGGNV